MSCHCSSCRRCCHSYWCHHCFYCDCSVVGVVAFVVVVAVMLKSRPDRKHLTCIRFYFFHPLPVQVLQTKAAQFATLKDHQGITQVQIGPHLDPRWIQWALAFSDSDVKK